MPHQHRRVLPVYDLSIPLPSMMPFFMLFLQRKSAKPYASSNASSDGYLMYCTSTSCNEALNCLTLQRIGQSHFVRQNRALSLEWPVRSERWSRWLFRPQWLVSLNKRVGLDPKYELVEWNICLQMVQSRMWCCWTCYSTVSPYPLIYTRYTHMPIRIYR